MKNLILALAAGGYTVFGEVLYGMHLVQDIVRYKTGALGSFDQDVPLKSVIIKSMRIMQDSEEIPIQPIILDDNASEVAPDIIKSNAQEQVEKAKTKTKTKIVK